MGDLAGLPGVKGGKIENVQFARSVTGALEVLKTDRAVTGAGDHGAWTVWRDDDGAYRCDFSRHSVTHSKLKTHAKAGVRLWLKEWLPRVHERVA